LKAEVKNKILTSATNKKSRCFLLNRY